MAQNENLFTRLGKLFSSQIVVRKTDDGQIYYHIPKHET